MLSRIAAFELRMYFIPGAYGLILASILSKVITGLDFFNSSLQGGDLTQSFAFVIASYVLGHLIQSVGHGARVFGRVIGPEQRLKKRYWNGHFPSELALFKGSTVLGESNRRYILDALERNGYLEQLQKQEYEMPLSDMAKEKAQAIFIRLNAKAGEKEDSPVKTAEGLYQMLRGLFFSSWLGFVLATVLAIYTKVARIWFVNMPPLTRLSWPGLAIYIVFCLSAWLIFRYRCRGAGEGYVRRVFLTATTP